MEDLIDLFLGKFTGREETGEDASLGRNSQPLKALERRPSPSKGREEGEGKVQWVDITWQSRRPRQNGSWREWSRS